MMYYKHGIHCTDVDENDITTEEQTLIGKEPLKVYT